MIQLKTDYIKFGINTVDTIIWMSDEQILDYTSFLIIIEDIIETFPIEHLENIFDKVEANFKSKSYVI
jgi:hypothetical protein